MAPSAVDEVREAVARGLQHGVALSFTYQAPDAAPTTRTVDPVQILITNGQWYLQGWCHLRQAMRTFHLDRVSAPVLTDIPITHGGDLVPEAFVGLDAEREVTVRVPERLAPLLTGFLPRGTEHTVVNGTVTMKLHLADPRGIKRLAARFGGSMVVLDPGIARSAARDWAASGLALYRRPDPEV
ncbi:WYL domain-containing protein [uncultured Microbacterium sp.]|uniref:helix-turn-helix transcriptional regulator n=1 Tax=uncultured Microbacterium sp. TaxID=191216 RepID=UPI00338FBB2D